MKNIQIQFRLLAKRKIFAITMTIMILFSILVFILNCVQSFNEDIISVKAAKYLFMGSDFLDAPFYLYSIIFPIFSALPFSDTFFEEKKNRTYEFCITRMSNNSYYFSKMFTVFCSGFLIASIPLLINMLLNFIAFPIDSSVDATNLSYVNSGLFGAVMETGLFQNLFAKNMYLYNLLYLFFASFISGLIAVIVYQLSYFYKKSRILLISSFFMAYHFISVLLQAFDLSEFCLENYIFASRFFCEQSARGMAVTFAIMILAALLPIPFAKKRLNECYE